MKQTQLVEDFISWVQSKPIITSPNEKDALIEMGVNSITDEEGLDKYESLELKQLLTRELIS